MKRFFGFSLAEALITLLIVSIIVIATVPVITKKKRNLPSSSSVNVLWSADRIGQGSVYPKEKRDIKLGEITPGSSQGIVIAGTLEFKDKNGRTIGWIKENGENSFSNTGAIIQKQEEIIQMLNALTTSLENAVNYSSGYQDNSYNSYGRRSRHPSSTRGSADGIDKNITPEQMQRILEIQKQIETMMSQRSR